MSKQALWICCILLGACVGVAKWHHSLDVERYELILDGDRYMMSALAQRIDERDEYIARLEQFIINLEIETE